MAKEWVLAQKGWGASLLLAAGALAAGMPDPKASYRLQSESFQGDSTRMQITLELPPGWHIQSAAPADEFLIPTQVSVAGPGVQTDEPEFPPPKTKRMEALGGDVELYEGKVDIGLTLRKAHPKVKPAALTQLEVKVKYQACDDTQCLPPKEITVREGR